MNLKNHSDITNNTIIYSDKENEKVKVLFFGRNNKLIVHPEAKISGTTIRFDCDDGTCSIGNNNFAGFIRIGQGCSVVIGDQVTCTNGCYISTAENTSVLIGDDCMIASGNEIRTDDGHPIFDIASGKRINISRSIKIGEHVWLAAKSIVLSGSSIGNGSVIGLGSIVKSTIPNNSIAVGVPAKVIKKNIAWERPHLTLAKPFLKPDVSCITKSRYWEMTHQDDVIVTQKDNFLSKIIRLFRK
ncbi:acyltransferase [Rahnella laticis]|uniref:acyltransferase n=1 Tax=Rahnella laticis TaxID=2787622 RepID=UPI0018A2942C|nr:acyltransferase [Rahnella laticis]MBF7996198.1 acyltransferase [Rahnella laticis]